MNEAIHNKLTSHPYFVDSQEPLSSRSRRDGLDVAPLISDAKASQAWRRFLTTDPTWNDPEGLPLSGLALVLPGVLQRAAGLQSRSHGLALPETSPGSGRELFLRLVFGDWAVAGVVAISVKTWVKGGAPFSEPTHLANGESLTWRGHRKPVLVCTSLRRCSSFTPFSTSTAEAPDLGIGGEEPNTFPLCSSYIGSGAQRSKACAPILSSVT
eukprot:s164_g12.t1